MTSVASRRNENVSLLVDDTHTATFAASALLQFAQRSLEFNKDLTNDPKPSRSRANSSNIAAEHSLENFLTRRPNLTGRNSNIEEGSSGENYYVNSPEIGDASLMWPRDSSVLKHEHRGDNIALVDQTPQSRACARRQLHPAPLKIGSSIELVSNTEDASSLPDVDDEWDDFIETEKALTVTSSVSMTFLKWARRYDACDDEDDLLQTKRKSDSFLRKLKHRKHFKKPNSNVGYSPKDQNECGVICALPCDDESIGSSHSETLAEVRRNLLCRIDKRILLYRKNQSAFSKNGSSKNTFSKNADCSQKISKLLRRRAFINNI